MVYKPRIMPQEHSIVWDLHKNKYITWTKMIGNANS